MSLAVGDGADLAADLAVGTYHECGHVGLLVDTWK
tara:strand:- start:3935 stop:4039 length:105 start_codon:yes stop_codon:yes gene_type:complete